MQSRPLTHERAGICRVSPDISVIIPTRNRADVLRLSLPRFLAQSLPPDRFEIIVVDDASEDDTETAVAEQGRANLFFSKLPGHRAAGFARNRAIERARGELLVFVDDDSLVEPDFLSVHLDAHRGLTDGIVTGPIVEVDRPQTLPASSLRSWQGMHTNPFPTLNASVARSLVVDAGGFDEEFDEYGWEDPELYYRMRRNPVVTRYERRAPVFHYKPVKVRGNFSGMVEQARSRGRMGALFYAKHPCFSVGLQTKLLSIIRAADVMANAALGFDARLDRIMRTGRPPGTAVWRSLLLNHVEIDTGRRQWKRLGPEGREELARATRTKGKLAPR